MNKLLKAGLLLFLACVGTVQAQQKQDTIVVARDGTGEYLYYSGSGRGRPGFYGLHRYYIYKGWTV